MDASRTCQVFEAKRFMLANERFIRTLKENLLWVRWFETIEDLRLALLEFHRTYNETWIIQRHGYRTPAQVRRDQTTIMQTAA